MHNRGWIHDCKWLTWHGNLVCGDKLIKILHNPKVTVQCLTINISQQLYIAWQGQGTQCVPPQWHGQVHAAYAQGEVKDPSWAPHRHSCATWQQSPWTQQTAAWLQLAGGFIWSQWTPSHNLVSLVFLIVATRMVMRLVASAMTSPGIMGVPKSSGTLEEDVSWVSDCWVDIVKWKWAEWEWKTSLWCGSHVVCWIFIMIMSASVTHPWTESDSIDTSLNATPHANNLRVGFQPHAWYITQVHQCCSTPVEAVFSNN